MKLRLYRQTDGHGVMKCAVNATSLREAYSGGQEMGMGTLGLYLPSQVMRSMSKENLLFEDGLNRLSCLEKRHLNGNKIQNVKLQMVWK